MAIADTVQRMAEAPVKAVRKAFDGIARWAEVQRVLAVALVGSPLVMYVFDEITIGSQSGFRDSISAYYTMRAAPAFYVPLTIAAMLFVVHGVINKGRAHNWLFGIALLAVVVFNKDGFGWIHYPAAAGFYAGNAWAIARTEADSWNRKGTLLGIGGATLLWWLLFRDGVSMALLIAEWIGLALIAVHFFFDANPKLKYQAPRQAGVEQKAAFAA